MNQLIHSYTIIFSFDNKDILNGIFINSDITKEKSLYYLPIYTILTIFLTVSEGDITDAISYRELIGNDKKDKPVFGEMKLKKTIQLSKRFFD